MVRNNHYVPQHYLRSWSSDSNQKKIWVYDKLVPHQNVPLWKNESIESTASMRDFYTIVKDDEETDEIETELNALYETPFTTEVLPKILSRDRLSSRDWDIFNDYVLIQYLRTPKRYSNIISWANNGIPSLLESAVHDAAYNISHGIIHYKTPRPIPFIENFPLGLTIDDTNHTINASAIAGKGLYLNCMRYLSQKSFKLRYAVHDLNWHFIYPPDGIVFPTSDDPVICLSYQDEHNYNFNGGFGRKNCDIIFPISPDICLYAQVKNRKKGLGLSSPDHYIRFCLQLCRFIAENSYRYIYSNSILDFVPDICPRTENIATWKSEKSERENSHKHQMALEKEFYEKMHKQSKNL